MNRSKTHGVVWRETISERHLTLPIDGDARYVVTTFDELERGLNDDIPR